MWVSKNEMENPIELEIIKKTRQLTINDESTEDNSSPHNVEDDSINNLNILNKNTEISEKLNVRIL